MHIVYVCNYVYIYTYICMYKYIYVYVYVYIYIYMCVCVCVCVCIYIDRLSGAELASLAWAHATTCHAPGALGAGMQSCRGVPII